LYKEKIKKPDLSVQAYLKRMNYDGPTDVSYETLKALQLAHLQNVPYENLDILAGKPISLSMESLYDKVVARRRGGYCFELNGIFGWLLKELGFEVIEYLGRWLKGEPIEVPVRRHRVLIVNIDGKSYVADVGLGHFGSKWPLLFEEGLEQEQDDEKYRIVSHDKMGWIVQSFEDGQWGNVFSFSIDLVQPIDFLQPSWYCTTHPDSIFLHNTMVYRRTPEGRNTIADIIDPVTGEKVKQIRIFKGNTVETVVPSTEKEFLDALKEYFGIELNNCS
jgi:arylamine N-acetyltransferase